jgi:hypothetical protein
MSRKNDGLDFDDFDSEILESNSDDSYKNNQDSFDGEDYFSDYDGQELDVDQFLNDID